MQSGASHKGGLPSQPVQVTRQGGGRFFHVKTWDWGNPHNRGNQITAPKPAKTHGRTTRLPTATNAASYFENFTSKTTKTLMKLTVLATI